MIKIYVASPYTKGDVALNVSESLKIANELINLGYAPYAPLLTHFQHMMFPQPYEKWLELDFDWIGVCDCLLRLPGESSGADREIEEAIKLRKPVFYNIKELNAYYFKQILINKSLEGVNEDWGMILEKQFEIAGYNLLFGDIDFKAKNATWFSDLTWTKEKSDCFKEWFINCLYNSAKVRKSIMAIPQKNKKTIEKVYGMWNLMWGFRLTD